MPLPQHYQTVLENPWATVRYYPNERLMYHRFKRPISGEPFRETVDTALAHLAEHGGTKWLSDDRKNGEFSEDDIRYAVEDWGPRAAKTDWQYWALIVPKDTGGRASMKSLINAFHGFGVHVAIFTDMDDATKWVLEQ